MTEMEEKFLMSIGDFRSGFQFHGPFGSCAALRAYAESLDAQPDEYSIETVQAPKLLPPITIPFDVACRCFDQELYFSDWQKVFNAQILDNDGDFTHDQVNDRERMKMYIFLEKAVHCTVRPLRASPETIDEVFSKMRTTLPPSPFDEDDAGITTVGHLKDGTPIKTLTVKHPKL